MTERREKGGSENTATVQFPMGDKDLQSGLEGEAEGYREEGS